MFSPYYAWSRRHGTGDPLEHCALNVALYGPRGKRWACTERGRPTVQQESSALRIGPSALRWDDNALTIMIDEMTVPLPSRLRGKVRLYPAALVDHTIALDAAGRHRWSPLAPYARIEVEMTHPALRWTGAAYLDSNNGDDALESAFAHWHWSRAGLRDGTAVLYDVTRRDGSTLSVATHFGASGAITHFTPPHVMALPPTHWRVARATRSDAGPAATVTRTLEDTPFYARSVLAAQLLGEPVTAIHESLSLDRFNTRWVQMLLPFRMPRRRG